MRRESHSFGIPRLTISAEVLMPRILSMNHIEDKHFATGVVKHLDVSVLSDLSDSALAFSSPFSRAWAWEASFFVAV